MLTYHPATEAMLQKPITKPLQKLP